MLDNVHILPLYEENIVQCWIKASKEDVKEGKEWYYNVHKHCIYLANSYGIDSTSVMGVVAALSPGSSWELNLTNTRKLIELYLDNPNQDIENLKHIGTYGKNNVLKAWQILQGVSSLDVLGGNKVRDFFICIAIPDNKHTVVIDRHALSIALGVPLSDTSMRYINSDRKYKFIASRYIYVAKVLGVLPNQLQAVTWVYWRRIHNVRKTRAVKNKKANLHFTRRTARDSD